MTSVGLRIDNDTVRIPVRTSTVHLHRLPIPVPSLWNILFQPGYSWPKL